jgi:hypothetical protein
MNMHTGIVLRHYDPQKNTCALLDCSLGRITGVLVHDHLSAGTVLQYRLVRKKEWYIMEQVEMIHMPLFLARSEMLFLHYVLEMCYHFVPEGSGVSRLFDLLIFIFDQHSFSIEQKKVILCVLLVYLELYPENAAHATAHLYMLGQLPLPEILNKKIDVKVEKNIAEWLYQSIEVHMGTQQFKTIHFLDEIR